MSQSHRSKAYKAMTAGLLTFILVNLHISSIPLRIRRCGILLFCIFKNLGRDIILLYRKALITIITITLIGGSVLPGLVPSTYAAESGTMIDPWLEQWLPTIGENGGVSPFMPSNQGLKGTGLHSIPENTSVWGGSIPNSSGVTLPEEPILLPKGSLVLNQDDFILVC